MNQIDQKENQDIDFFDLIQKLWSSKKIIANFVFIALLFASLYVYLKEPQYESRLHYSVQTMPPFYKSETVDMKDQAVEVIKSQLKKTFYTKSNFDNWKKDNKNTVITFDDFSETQIIEGYVFSKSEDEKLATLASDEVIGSYLLARTKNLSLLNDFYNYAMHVNTILKSEFILKAKYELDNIDARIKRKDTSSFSVNTEEEINEIKQKSLDERTTLDYIALQEYRAKEEKARAKDIVSETIMGRIYSLQSYIDESKRGAEVFTFYRPTLPKVVSARTSVVLFLFGSFGALIGIFFVLINNSIQKRKN
jgi:hypothetical protein